jgi:ketosteroid isomerase-like protein
MRVTSQLRIFHRSAVMSKTTIDPELEKVHKVVSQTYAAWNSRNTDNANAYFREAPEDMFFDYWPLRFDDWRTYKDGAQAYLNTLDVQKIIEKQMRVQRVGDTAWTSATYDVDPVSKKGETFHVRDGRHTSVLVRTNAAWKVCHEHWSPRAPAEPLVSYPGASGVRTIKAASGEETIRGVTNEVFKGWNVMNIENSAPLYRRDAEDSFFHLFSGKLERWEDFAAGVRTFFGQHESFTIEPTDTRIFREGDVAWAAVTWEARETLKNGTAFARSGRYTGVLMGSGSHWKVVHEHWSVPVRAAGWENY